MRALPALALLCLSASPAFAAPTPYEATYAVSRDGKVIGESHISLRETGQGEWSLVTQTKGTAGMARLLGLDVREASRFRWQGGAIQSLDYDYEQDAAIKHKQRHAAFDWQAGRAEIKDGGKHFDYAVELGTLDRHAVSLALGEAVAAGKSDVQLDVAVKDHVEQQRYRVEGEEALDLPAGRLLARRVERTDAPGKIRSWYAAGKLLPVKLEQTQGDKSVIVMELKGEG